MHNQWDVELSFDEDGVHTGCEARLTGARAPGLSARGEAVKSIDDRPLARIGEEVAASAPWRRCPASCGRRPPGRSRTRGTGPVTWSTDVGFH